MNRLDDDQLDLRFEVDDEAPSPCFFRDDRWRPVRRVPGNATGAAAWTGRWYYLPCILAEPGGLVVMLASNESEESASRLEGGIRAHRTTEAEMGLTTQSVPIGHTPNGEDVVITDVGELCLQDEGVRTRIGLASDFLRRCRATSV
jgi:hypothetical protein